MKDLEGQRQSDPKTHEVSKRLAVQVSLMKTMETSQKGFQQWKKQRERELMTLKRQVGR